MTKDGRIAAAAGHLEERHVLAAAGASPAISRWRLYQIMAGAEPDRFERPAEPLRDHMRRALEGYLESTLAVAVSQLAGPTVFEGRFHAESPRLMTAPGAAPEVLMIETPRQREFDYQWRVGYDTAVPASVVARANLRMAVAGAASAVLWIVGDNGAVDEFHRVAADRRLVDSLRESCRAMEAAVASGEEPSPDDDDLSDYILAMKGPPLPLLPVSAGSPEAEAYRTLQAIEREMAASAAALQQQRSDQRGPRSLLLRACAGRKGLEIDGKVVRTEMVHVQAKERKSYSFPRVVVDTPEGP